MRRTWFGSAIAAKVRLGIVGAMAGWLLTPAQMSGQVSGQASGQTQSRSGQTAVTRTPDGQPDFQGFWATDAYTADMETGLPDDETATLQGQARPDRAKAVSAVIDPPDGLIPYQPWAAARRVSIPSFRRGETSRGKPSTVRDIRPRTFCLHGPPRSMFTDFQVVQTAGSVVLAWEFNHAYRLIHLNGGPRIAPNVKLAMGDSRGRWEGNTLVVDTTNLNDWDWFDYTGTFRTAAMTLVERFTITDANTMQYRATIEDPNVFTRPWTFQLMFKRTHTPGDGYELIEHACVEGERGVAALLEEAARP